MVEELHYLLSKNKGSDQLHEYLTADLICAFVFTYAKSRSSHCAAHILLLKLEIDMLTSEFRLILSEIGVDDDNM